MVDFFHDGSHYRFCLALGKLFIVFIVIIIVFVIIGSAKVENPYANGEEQIRDEESGAYVTQKVSAQNHAASACRNTQQKGEQHHEIDASFFREDRNQCP